MNEKNNKKNDGKRRYRDRNKGATYYITCNINRFKTELTEIEIKEMLLFVLSRAKLKFKFEMKDFVILNPQNSSTICKVNLIYLIAVNYKIIHL